MFFLIYAVCVYVCEQDREKGGPLRPLRKGCGLSVICVWATPPVWLSYINCHLTGRIFFPCFSQSCNNTGKVSRETENDLLFVYSHCIHLQIVYKVMHLFLIVPLTMCLDQQEICNVYLIRQLFVSSYEQNKCTYMCLQLC